MGKIYAVRKGRKTGLFHSWPECQKQVSAFPGAEFKSFKNQQDAQIYLKQGQAQASQSQSLDPNVMRVYVDGSFDKTSQRYGYAGVVLYQGQEKTFQGSGNSADLAKMRNVAGEIMAAMRAVKVAQNLNAKALEIYYDYAGIAAWAQGDWQAKQTYTQDYRDYMQAQRQNLKISFHKVAAHTGDTYNEKADLLAKEAVAKQL